MAIVTAPRRIARPVTLMLTGEKGARESSP
jgi:hypothetical protein